MRYVLKDLFISFLLINLLFNYLFNLIIEGIVSNGDKEELTVCGNIESESSDTIKFNPEDVQDEVYQSLEYYCEYHLDTMRGKILITQ